MNKIVTALLRSQWDIINLCGSGDQQVGAMSNSKSVQMRGGLAFIIFKNLFNCPRWAFNILCQYLTKKKPLLRDSERLKPERGCQREDQRRVCLCVWSREVQTLGGISHGQS